MKPFLDRLGEFSLVASDRQGCPVFYIGPLRRLRQVFDYANECNWDLSPGLIVVYDDRNNEQISYLSKISKKTAGTG